jgi:hypothetical protein
MRARKPEFVPDVRGAATGAADTCLKIAWKQVLFAVEAGPHRRPAVAAPAQMSKNEKRHPPVLKNTEGVLSGYENSLL